MKFFLLIISIFSFRILFASDLDSHLYHDHSISQYNHALTLIEKMELKGGEQILDVGCGDGKISNLISQKLVEGSLLGIDRSPSMVDFATQNYTTNSCRFQLLDLNNFSVEGLYDCVTIFSALFCFENPESTLKKLLKALKPGGRLYVLDYPKEDIGWLACQDALSKDADLNSYQDDSIFSRLLTGDQYKELTKRLDAHIISFRTYDTFSVHTDLDEYREYVASWISLFAQVPIRANNSYVDSICNQCESLFVIDAAGELKFPVTRVEVILEKPQ